MSAQTDGILRAIQYQYRSKHRPDKTMPIIPVLPHAVVAVADMTSDALDETYLVHLVSNMNSSPVDVLCSSDVQVLR